MHRVVLLIAIWLVSAPSGAQDWPQFQQNGQRHGRLAVGPVGPFRARWIWLGPNQVLRNKDSQPGWSDDLTGLKARVQVCGEVAAARLQSSSRMSGNRKTLQGVEQ
jgi:hypothetical protein